MPARGPFPALMWISLCIALCLLSCHLLKGHGYESRLMHRLFPASRARFTHPTVIVSRPGDLDGGVFPDAFVAADVFLPNSGQAIDPGTVHAGSIRLFCSADHQPVEALVNTSGGGDSIVLKPIHPLRSNTQYTFEVLPALKDTGGNSFRHYKISFTTAASQQASAFPAAFDQAPQTASAGRKYTCLAMGPDHRLYAATLDGRILRFALDSEGNLTEPVAISTIVSAGGGPRLITGICFDPAATVDDPVLWVSHGAAESAHPPEWSCKISRLSGPDLRKCQDYVIGLPRSNRDHLTNQLVFGPDGAIYFGQASQTAMGAPDSQWGFRPERMLSAAILRLDPRKVAMPPIDVRTPDGGGTYDPLAPSAPLTIYATGVRNAFDLLWHSNGRLYAPVNGSSAGGNAPGSPQKNVPALQHIPLTEPDFLAGIEPGGYYGHPNPARGEFILDGGHPASEAGPFDIPEYPIGTRPDSNWRKPLFNFGEDLAPVGLIEYHSDLCPALNGAILVARFSGGKDIMALIPGSDGTIVESVAGIDGFTRLASPLSLIEDPSSGLLYVSEFSGKKITLLRPRIGSLSQQACVTPNR